ncbi:MAG: ArnT family glycosyltransferase [Vicinamibacterales bacterium]
MPGAQLPPPAASDCRALIAGAVALLALLYVYPLAIWFPLLDPAEGTHASISQEMVERGQFLVPTLFGVAFEDKPILFFWLQTASLRLLGMTEAAIRLPGLLFGVLGAITTGLLGWRLFGRRAGLIAVVVEATMLMPMAQSQAGAHDVMLVVWVNLALLALWMAMAADSVTRGALATVGAGAAVGLAILTKGLVGPAIVYVTLGLTLLATRRLTTRTLALTAASGILGVLVAMPWYLRMEQVTPGYLYYYFAERHLAGFATDTQRHGGQPVWYYLPVMIAGGLPWAAFLPSAWANAGPVTWAGTWRTRATDAPDRPVGAEAPDHARRFVWIWLAGGLLLLSAASSKLATYALPLFPPLALLVALAWQGRLDGTRDAARGTMAGVWLQTLLLAAAPVAAISVVGREYGVSYPLAVRVGASAVALAWLLPVFAWRRHRHGLAFWGTAGTMTATLLFVLTWLLPPVAPSLSARDLGVRLAEHPLPARLWLVDERVASVVFYLTPEQRVGLTPDRIESVGLGSLPDRLRDTQVVPVVAVRERQIDELAARIAGLTALPFARAGQFRLYDGHLLAAALPHDD